MKVVPLGRTKEVVSYYKRFVIKGHLGRFRLTGSEELIKIVMEAGLGGKNSSGYGLIT